MPTFFRDGLITVFVFFIFITLYLVLSSLGHPLILIWVFLGVNMLLMGVSLFLVLEASEKSVKESGHEARVFWLVSLGIFILVGVLLQFIFLFESRVFTPSTVGLGATLTTLAATYYLMAKEMYETRLSAKLQK